MENNTLSFIQLVKSILEYYGTTKDMKPKEVAQEMSGLERAESIIENFDDFDMDNIFVEIPKDVDEEVKKTFLHQLKLHQVETEKKETYQQKGGQLLG